MQADSQLGPKVWSALGFDNTQQNTDEYYNNLANSFTTSLGAQSFFQPPNVPYDDNPMGVTLTVNNAYINTAGNARIGWNNAESALYPATLSGKLEYAFQKNYLDFVALGNMVNQTPLIHTTEPPLGSLVNLVQFDPLDQADLTQDTVANYTYVTPDTEITVPQKLIKNISIDTDTIHSAVPLLKHEVMAAHMTVWGDDTNSGNPVEQRINFLVSKWRLINGLVKIPLPKTVLSPLAPHSRNTPIGHGLKTYIAQLSDDLVRPGSKIGDLLVKADQANSASGQDVPRLLKKFKNTKFQGTLNSVLHKHMKSNANRVLSNGSNILQKHLGKGLGKGLSDKTSTALAAILQRNSIGSQEGSNGGGLMDMIKGIFQDGFGAVKDGFKGIVDEGAKGIKDAAHEVGKGIKGGVDDAAKAVKGGIDDAMKGVMEIF